MSMSLRDQLLQAGLVSQKQVRDAEREEERQQQRQRHQPKHQRPQGSKNAQPQHPHAHARPHAESKPGPQRAQSQQPQPQRPQSQRPPGHVPGPERGPPPPRLPPDLVAARMAQSAKVARDQALSRRQQDKAHKKALQAQIKQLIEQNRLTPDPSDEGYNFVHGTKIRRIPVNAALRGPLNRGEIFIVCHEARYDLVPADIAARIRERDDSAVIAITATPPSSTDDAYQEFSVPDDLIW